MEASAQSEPEINFWGGLQTHDQFGWKWRAAAEVASARSAGPWIDQSKLVNLELEPTRPDDPPDPEQGRQCVVVPCRPNPTSDEFVRTAREPTERTVASRCYAERAQPGA